MGKNVDSTTSVESALKLGEVDFEHYTITIRYYMYK